MPVVVHVLVYDVMKNCGGPAVFCSPWVVQFLDKFVAMPVVFYDRCTFSARSLTRPLCYNDRGHGPDSAVPGQGCCYACCFCDRCTWVPDVQKNVWRCRRCSSAWLWDVPCDHATPMAVLMATGRFKGFFGVFTPIFRAPLRS